MVEPPRWALARQTVRHVGEPVAAVFAETRALAEDAAERVEVDYEVLPLIDKETCFRWTRGDAAAVDAAFATAAHRVDIELVNNRLCGAAIETRGVISTGDTLYCATQAPHHIRQHVCAELGLREIELRVVSPDMGGGFGYKGKHYPEETIAVWAARRLRRPVKWIATRHESFLSDTQGRDHRTRASLALDRRRALSRASRCRRRPISGLTSRPSARRSRGRSTARCWPGFTERLRSMSKSPGCSRTASRPTRIAAPAALRPATCSSASRTRRRASSASTAPRFAAATSFRRRRCRTRRRSGRPTTAATFRASSSARSRFRITRDSKPEEDPRRTGRLRGIGLACYLESSGVAPSRLAGMMGARVGFYEAATVRVAPDCKRHRLPRHA